jgi:hypothetical protein
MNLRPVVQEIRAAHVRSLRKIARCLNARGYKTPNGKSFAAQSVKNLMTRMAVATAAAEPEPNRRCNGRSRPQPATPKRATLGCL